MKKMTPKLIWTPVKPLQQKVMEIYRNFMTECKCPIPNEVASFIPREQEVSVGDFKVLANIRDTIWDKNNDLWQPILKRKTYCNIDNGKSKVYRLNEFLEGWLVNNEKTLPPPIQIEMKGLSISFDSGIFPLEDIEYNIIPTAEITMELECEEGWCGIWDYH